MLRSANVLNRRERRFHRDLEPGVAL